MARHLFAGLILKSLLVVVAGPAIATPFADAAQPVSQCVQCHTDVKGLIRLSWEVEKRRPELARSPETTGEG